MQCIVYDSGRQRVEFLTKLACGAMIALAAGCAARTGRQSELCFHLPRTVNRAALLRYVAHNLLPAINGHTG